MTMDGQAYTLANEGFRNQAYLDSLGRPTIGVGHTGPEVQLGLVWSDDQVNQQYRADYQIACNGAAADIGAATWIKLDPIRASAIIDMVFELGKAGEAKFVHMIDAIQAFDWETAASQLLNSLLAHQVPGRAHANAQILRTGAWS